MIRGLKYFERHKPWAAICFRLIFSWVFSSSRSEGNMCKEIKKNKCEKNTHCWSVQIKVILKRDEYPLTGHHTPVHECALCFPF